MTHDARVAGNAQATAPLAQALRRHLLVFLEPVRVQLAGKLDIRLLQTLFDLVQAILTHRHRQLALLLQELGGVLLGGQHAPAGAKRISNLVHSADWSHEDIDTVLWQQALERVDALEREHDQPLLVWDGSVWEKPESLANPDWCVLRSAKGRRLSRRRKGLTLPHHPSPIGVPGLHWDGLVVLGSTGAPTLAHLCWWSRRGSHASSQQEVNGHLLARCVRAWGRRVRHIFDRGYASNGWIAAALNAQVRFVVRWKKKNHLLNTWGDEQAASAMGRGKRSKSHRFFRDPRTHEQVKVGVVSVPVNVREHAQPLWLVITRLGGGREPWYLLTDEVLSSDEQVWQVVEAYARRWQIELVWRFSKSELGFESPRVWDWLVRLKLLLLATLAYAFMLHLLASSFDELRDFLLRNFCHRSGSRYREVQAPLYRLRSALSKLWQSAPPPGRHVALC